MYVCPNCGGPVKIEKVKVEVGDNYELTRFEGYCEKCGVRYIREVVTPLHRKALRPYLRAT
jgi:rRNA maturation endonuclease Nob1